MLPLSLCQSGSAQSSAVIGTTQSLGPRSPLTSGGPMPGAEIPLAGVPADSTEASPESGDADELPSVGTEPQVYSATATRFAARGARADLGVLESRSHSVVRSPRAVAVIGRHYVSEILKGLRAIGAAGEASAASVAPVLHAIKDLSWYAPSHPASHVAIALYDAMVANDLWPEYGAEQYVKAAEILHSAGKDATAQSGAIARWLSELWELGFDVAPYGTKPDP